MAIMHRLVVLEADSSMRNCVLQSIDWAAIGFDIVASFSNGEEAIEYFKCMPVDVVLLAAELPHITGMEVAAFIHQNLPDCCVVMTGMHRDYDLVKQAMQIGVCDYILKPINLDELRGSLEKVRDNLNISRQRTADILTKSSKKYSQSMLHSQSMLLAQHVMSYVDQHILEDVGLEMVSKQLHVSTSHLIRTFKKETGHTYLEYVTKKKMDKAAEYLEKEHLKVYEVSEKLGYRSTRYFSALFFRRFGCYPSAYVDMLTNNGQQRKNEGK